MGADGHWMLIKREAFQAAFPDVRPEDIGVYRVTVLGVEALGGYRDTNGFDFAEYAKTDLVNHAEGCRRRIALVQRDGTNGVYERKPSGFPFRDVRIVEADESTTLAQLESHPDFAAQQRNAEALRWFEKNAEDHCVWT